MPDLTDEERVTVSQRLWSEVCEEADPNLYREDDIGYIAYEFAGGVVVKRNLTDYTA